VDVLVHTGKPQLAPVRAQLLKSTNQGRQFRNCRCT
jgi:hypothetical protein